MKFIYISRQDIIAQAVSTTIALKTGVWEKRANNKQSSEQKIALKEKNTPLQFQPLKIYRWEKSFKDQNRRWKNFFDENNLNYYELTYERLTSSFEPEISSILDFLDIDKNSISHKIQMATKKQSTGINQRFIGYYKMLPKLLIKVVYKIDRQFKN